MRICYLADGRSMHFHRWLKYFANCGHEMYFISYLPVNETHIKQIERSGADYLGEIGPFHIKRFWETSRDLRWLRNVLKEKGIQVLHCHFLGANAWYAALSNFHPLVITVMGGGDVCGPQWKPNSSQRERFLTPFALQRADLLTSWSYSMAKTVRPYCRNDVEIIHGGVDLSRFYSSEKPEYLYSRWEIPGGAKVVFSPRLMRPLSNIDVIAEASVKVCAEFNDVYFLFAAPETARDIVYENKVRTIVENSPAANNVRFIGAIPHDEMADHYRLADVTVSIPSTDGTPMTVLESMACGTPVVVSDIPDYDPRYIEPGKTVLSARPEDTDGLAEAILRLLDEPDLAKRLAVEAGNRVRAEGSYEAQMSRMEKLYLNLLDNA